MLLTKLSSRLLCEALCFLYPDSNRDQTILQCTYLQIIAIKELKLPMLKHSRATSMKYSITLALCFFFTGCKRRRICRVMPSRKQHSDPSPEEITPLLKVFSICTTASHCPLRVEEATLLRSKAFRRAKINHILGRQRARTTGKEALPRGRI